MARLRRAVTRNPYERGLRGTAKGVCVGTVPYLRHPDHLFHFTPPLRAGLAYAARVAGWILRVRSTSSQTKLALTHILKAVP